MNTSTTPPSEEQPIFTEMKDHGAIGVFENFVKPEFCDSLVDMFEFWYTKKYFKNLPSTHDVCKMGDDTFTLDHFNDGGTQFPQGGMGRKDHQLYLEICDQTMTMQVNQSVGMAFEMYVQKYKGSVSYTNLTLPTICSV